MIAESHCVIFPINEFGSLLKKSPLERGGFARQLADEDGVCYWMNSWSPEEFPGGILRLPPSLSNELVGSFHSVWRRRAPFHVLIFFSPEEGCLKINRQITGGCGLGKLSHPKSCQSERAQRRKNRIV